MNTIVASRLESIQFGDVQSHKSIAILPLFSTDGRFEYRTLSESLANSDITIKEISGSGSVPQLLVSNRGEMPVLLLDGEELAGAKQNRVLNTSILIDRTSETRIPVSCTEQGRWSYSSPSFAESGNVMAFKARSLKSYSVSLSLGASGSFESNQHEVWQSIDHLHAKAGFQSPTSAMNDLFKARENDLRQCDEIFQCIPGQVGLFAFTDGRPAGFDLVSRKSAYSQLHCKLVRSYALECLIECPRADTPQGDYVSMAQRFVTATMAASEQSFPSVGCGSDHRYRGESLAGAALVHEDEVIHAAFFQLDPAGRARRPSPFDSSAASVTDILSQLWRTP